jgi:glycosyltransferase involved in cell wall biosynthesis
VGVKVKGGAGGSRAARSPWLSVIVPVHNGRLQLSRCLEALTKSEYANFEVIVVDDCSTDNTRQIVERHHVRYVRTPYRMGPGGARNLGARQAQGTILVFVDTDVLLSPRALGLIAEQFEHDPELAAMFGSYDEAPAWDNFLSQYKNLMHHFIHQNSKERAVTFWAGCGAMRRARFEEMGGFDAQKYPKPSIEDIELGLRLVRAGGKIRLEKQLQVKHLKRWTLRGLLRADIFYRAVPWTKLILETRNLPRDLNLTYSAQLSAGLVGLLVVLAALLSFSGVALTQWIAPAVLLTILAAIVMILLILNWRVYFFFGRKRGLRFAAGAVIAHWFYYLYSGLVFLLYSAVHLLEAPFGTLRGAVRRPRPQE